MQALRLENSNVFAGGVLTIKTLRDGEVIRTAGPFRNKVVSSDGYGRNLLIRQLAGITTYPIEIDSFAIGTGTTAAADGDTGLQTPTVSGIALTDVTVNNNVLTIDVFVADGTLTNGTYREVGFFCNGRLFSRVLLSSAYTKATGEDTLFTYTLTFSG